ncbi:MAG: DUF4384 domain-containing protein [Bacteroidetes bacterium]|nr:DUF4384 domain-containing protein [Bacteroidota bacterium]
MKKLLSYTLFVCLFFCFTIKAQKTISISNIKGTAFISGNVSPNQAKKEALNEAKINALKEAGINEHINSYQVLYASQQKNDYSQFFTSDIQTEIQGAVQSYTVKNEKTYCKNEVEIVCEIVIDAIVIKYDAKPDASFYANIEGIKAAYNNDEKLTFSVKATQACYLTVFNITDTEASLMYPNEYEKQTKCNALETYKFPVGRLDYVMHTDMKQAETNRLIFVFTKTQIPFIKMDKEQNTTAETIFTWIYSIMPDQRKVDYITLSIQK